MKYAGKHVAKMTIKRLSKLVDEYSEGTYEDDFCSLLDAIGESLDTIIALKRLLKRESLDVVSLTIANSKMENELMDLVDTVMVLKQENAEQASIIQDMRLRLAE